MFLMETYLPGFFVGLQKNTVLEGLFCVSFSRGSVSHWVERLHMYDFMKIGERIKTLRLDKGQSQELVAEKLEIHIKTYQKIENGSRLGRIDTLCLIAEYFEVSLDYLVGREELIDSKIANGYMKLSDDMKRLVKKQIFALIKAILE